MNGHEDASASEDSLRSTWSIGPLRPWLKMLAERQLSVEHRQVLTLRHIDGLSHQEIAKQIGRSNAATRMLWIRALEKLKAAYARM